MKAIFLAAIISLSLKGFSQKIDTTYYDKDWKPVQSRDIASYYGTKQKINDSTVLIKDYFMTDTVQNTGQYINGVKKGRWTFFHPDGTIKTDFEYTNNGANKLWYVFDEDDLEPNEMGVYHTVNNFAKFTGTETLNEYINANFALPQKAIKNGFVSFEVSYKITIDESGKVIDAYENRMFSYRDKNGEIQRKEIDSKLKYGTEKALTTFLLNMPNWEPATVRNKRVKSAQNINIKFKL